MKNETPITEAERGEMRRAYIQAFKGEARFLSKDDIYELREQFYRAITGHASKGGDALGCDR